MRENGLVYSGFRAHRFHGHGLRLGTRKRCPFEFGAAGALRTVSRGGLQSGVALGPAAHDHEPALFAAALGAALTPSQFRRSPGTAGPLAFAFFAIHGNHSTPGARPLSSLNFQIFKC